jgi:hypothetical protein
MISGVALVAIAIAAYFVFRSQSTPKPTATASEYISALEPVVSRAQILSQRMGEEPPGPDLFDAAAQLESDWAKVRTGPGYDRARHDDFIIVFGSFVRQLKSAGLIWKALNEDSLENSSNAQGRQLEILFTLQSLNGAETTAQLLSRRGLEMDELLSRTNLAFEVTNSLAQAPAVLSGAVRLFNDLQSASATP